VRGGELVYADQVESGTVLKHQFTVERHIDFGDIDFRVINSVS
jgi:hypothetical protein